MLSFSSPVGNASLMVAHPRAPHPSRHTGSIVRTPSEILPRLWLSSLYTAVDDEQLIELGVTHIVSVIEQRPRYPNNLPKLKTLHVPLQDVEGADILQHLDTTTAFIKSALEDKRSVVLVHCAMGISRSATVVCAYLVAAHGFAPHDAIDFVIAKREIVCPNLSFRRQLDIYAARLHGGRKLRKLSLSSAAPSPSPAPAKPTPAHTHSHGHGHGHGHAHAPPVARTRSRATVTYSSLMALTEWLRPPQARNFPPPEPLARRGSMA
ncbi:protein-tyrosine phosphatase-like protein [Daedaleopsis nitida]|nr:protein-tyrosine phosphatase-like protein [Daedaleopsis nitida]